MSVRARFKAEVGISSTTAEEKDLGNLSHEVQTDDLGEGATQKVVVPAGAAGQVIPCPSIASAKFLYVRTSPKTETDTPTQLDFALNGGAEVLPVTPLGTTKVGFLAVTHPGITSLTVNNGGTVDMVVIVSMAGD
jgi:hypothetical protein